MDTMSPPTVRGQWPVQVLGAMVTIFYNSHNQAPKNPYLWELCNIESPIVSGLIDNLLLLHNEQTLAKTVDIEKCLYYRSLLLNRKPTKPFFFDRIRH